VPIIDTLLARHLVTRAELEALIDSHPGARGCRRAQEAFSLTDPASQSPPESILRVRLVLGGVPKPTAQCPVQLPSGLILHPDLAWKDWQVAVEYDGHWHAEPDQLHRDRHRLNQLIVAGWTVLHVTSSRLHNDFPAVLREVKSALHTKGWRPAPPDGRPPRQPAQAARPGGAARRRGQAARPGGRGQAARQAARPGGAARRPRAGQSAEFSQIAITARPNPGLTST